VTKEAKNHYRITTGNALALTIVANHYNLVVSTLDKCMLNNAY